MYSQYMASATISIPLCTIRAVGWPFLVRSESIYIL